MQLELPVIQNWSCHNCSGCCRQHVIEITDEEKARIESQGWTAADGIENGGPVIVKLGRKRHRLAHQKDGACIFLQDDGLCRIHAKFGEPAKPLACQVYPYAFHPAGKKQTVSLRFSCPSVVKNLGTPVDEQRSAIKKIARQAVAKQATTADPPLIRQGQSVDWNDFHRFVEFTDTILETGDPLLVRLRRLLFCLNLLDDAVFDKVKGDKLIDFLQILADASAAQDYSAESKRPGKIARVQFRMLAAVYSRHDTSVELEAGLGLKWRLLKSAISFARGSGSIPVFRDELRSVPFAALENDFGGLPEGADEILTRYFQVKVQGHHFCGPAFYQFSFVDGLRSLILVFPAVLWFARWLAVLDNRKTLHVDDIITALTFVDHNHGYSGALGTAAHRGRVRTLAKTNDIERLCAWYSR